MIHSWTKNDNIDIYYSFERAEYMFDIKNYRYCIVKIVNHNNETIHQYSYEEIIQIIKTNKRLPKDILILLDDKHTHPVHIKMLKDFIKYSLTLIEVHSMLKTNPNLLEVFL